MSARRVPMRSGRPTTPMPSSRRLSGGPTFVAWLAVVSALLVLLAAQWFEPTPLIALGGSRRRRVRALGLAPEPDAQRQRPDRGDRRPERE
jgi:hypothetical protein